MPTAREITITAIVSLITCSFVGQVTFKSSDLTSLKNKTGFVCAIGAILTYCAETIQALNVMFCSVGSARPPLAAGGGLARLKTSLRFQ